MVSVKGHSKDKSKSVMKYIANIKVRAEIQVQVRVKGVTASFDDSALQRHRVKTR
jgi:hypothetical protein